MNAKLFEDFWNASDWLLSLVTDPEGKRYLESRSRSERLTEMKAQIPRLAEFLDFIGNPHRDFHSIHVAGTSGKGSVTAMIASVLGAAGIHSGHHISPYFQLPNEKLVVNGRPIRPTQFIALVDKFRNRYAVWESSASGHFLKYGEAWVALTLQHFSDQQLDWAVIETGMGGRYDPTNVVDSRLAVITNISFDHTESLGSTLEEIAWHKAGIIKPSSPIVTGERNSAALEVFQQIAAQQEARLLVMDKDFKFSARQDGSQSQILQISCPGGLYEDVPLNLPGWHQAENAALAVAALDTLASTDGLDISQDHIRKGLDEVQLPGRFEQISESPIILLDGAHNSAKMAALAALLRTKYPARKISVILGVLLTKDSNSMLNTLLPLVERWYLTAPKVFGKPAASPDLLAELLKSIHPGARQSIHESVGLAIDAALTEATDDDIILVTGSIYLVGEARGHWYSLESLLTAWELTSQG